MNSPIEGREAVAEVDGERASSVNRASSPSLKERISILEGIDASGSPETGEQARLYKEVGKVTGEILEADQGLGFERARERAREKVARTWAASEGEVVHS